MRRSMAPAELIHLPRLRPMIAPQVHSVTTRLPFSPSPPYFLAASNSFKAFHKKFSTSTHSFLTKSTTQALANPNASKANTDLRDPNDPFLEITNPTNPTLHLAENSPLLRGYSSDYGCDNFREKLSWLELMGVDFRKALEINPSIGSTSLQSLHNVVHFLQQMGMQHKDLGRIFGMCPHVLTSSIDQDLVPVFNFLVYEVKIPQEHIRKTINRCPRILTSSVKDRLRPALYYLLRLGFPNIRLVDCSNTILLVSSVENTLIPKLEYLKSLGFSHRDAVKIFKRCPRLFTYSIDNSLRPKYYYLINNIGGSHRDLKKFPQYFSFDLEKRIKPRHRLLLEYNVSLPLPTMLKASDGDFWDILQKLQAG